LSAAALDTDETVMVCPELAPTWKVAPWNVLVEVGAVARAVGGVERFDGQIAHALQVVGDLRQCARGSLGERYAIVGVLLGLVHAVDLRGHALHDRVAGGVVGRRIDTQARGQLLQRSGQLIARRRQAVLRDQRVEVRVED